MDNSKPVNRITLHPSNFKLQTSNSHTSHFNHEVGRRTRQSRGSDTLTRPTTRVLPWSTGLASVGGGRWRFDVGPALVTTVGLSGTSLVLAKPQTYMNLSGGAVSLLLSGHRLSLDDLIVICDDLALPAGRIRIRARGGDGGHNGLKSIIGASGHARIYPGSPGYCPRKRLFRMPLNLSCLPCLRTAPRRFRQMIHKGAEAVAVEFVWPGSMRP